MATENVKEYLFKKTGIAQSQWKRISKSKNKDGSEVRVFQDKSSGKTIETIEAKDGTISIIENSLKENNNGSTAIDKKVVIKLIRKVLEEGEELIGNEPGYSEIPKYFDFCFLEDANVDHTEAMEDAANALDPKVAVTSFNIFFIPKFKTPSSCMHLEEVLYPFLPDFLGETEEQSFTVHPQTMTIYDEERIEGIKNGTIPNIPYDRLIATLEKVGFNYDIKGCMLGNLGGSQGAEPLEVKEPPKADLKFCIVAVKAPNYNALYDETKNKDGDHMTALVIDFNKNREAKEKVVNQSLKNYRCVSPGRLINHNLPHLELIQLVGKKPGSWHTNEDDRNKIYEALIELGWEYDPSLASLENAQKWTAEQWAITPMLKTPGITVYSSSKVSDHESSISYYIWKPQNPKLKP